MKRHLAPNTASPNEINTGTKVPNQIPHFSFNGEGGFNITVILKTSITSQNIGQWKYE